MSTATLERPILAPIAETIEMYMTCIVCGEDGLLVCEQFKSPDVAICEDCTRAGKMPPGFGNCECAACTALIQEVRA